MSDIRWWNNLNKQAGWSIMHGIQIEMRDIRLKPLP